MLQHKYISLRDLLEDKNQPLSPKSSHENEEENDDFGYHFHSHSDSRCREEEDRIPLVTELFGELYFRETLPSSERSSISSLQFNPPLPLPQNSPNQTLNNADDCLFVPPKDGDEKKKKVGVSHANDIFKYNNSTKLFPPPISSLEMAKAGKPFTYQRLDETTEVFADETLMLPPKIMAASRENGCLKMKLAAGEGMEADSDEDIPDESIYKED